MSAPTSKKRTARKSTAANPGRVLALSFFLIILAGTILLTLPISSRSHTWTPPLTACFTAASATCVTGLSTVSTGDWWSPFGQLVLLLMIQLGGLGFMTLLYTLALLLRRPLSISKQLVLMGALNLDTAQSALQVARHALIFTFSCEGIGAVLLSFRFIPQFGLLRGLWYSLFHAVSAFCNAGFDLVGGLEHYADDPFVLLPLAALILCSGLGFFVWEELLWQRKTPHSFSTRLVLTASFLLVLTGTLLFLLLEDNNPATLGSLPLPQRLLNAFFQSVTLRTAGFSSIDQGALTESGKAVSILYMLVGGGSGSTAGGIKMGTVAVLLLALRAGLYGKDRVTAWGRTIPAHRVFNAMTLTLLVVMGVFAGAVFLSVVDQVPFLSAAYETASAIATVGLTTGITASLSAHSQMLLIALMYLGRVGILSFSFAVLTRRPAEEKLSYPHADIMIG